MIKVRVKKRKGKIQQVDTKTECNICFMRSVNWKIIRGRLLGLLRFYLSVLLSDNRLVDVFPSVSVFSSLLSSKILYFLWEVWRP